MNLQDIALRSIVIISLIGTCLHGYEVMYIREPFGPLIIPYGFLWMIFIITFWTCVWAITPKKWWR